MRDPVFYRWHAYIDFIFQSFKSTLPRYTVEQVMCCSIDNLETPLISIFRYSWTILGLPFKVSQLKLPGANRILCKPSGNNLTWICQEEWISSLAELSSLDSLTWITDRSITKLSCKAMLPSRELVESSWHPSSTKGTTRGCSGIRRICSLNWINSLWIVSVFVIWIYNSVKCCIKWTTCVYNKFTI